MHIFLFYGFLIYSIFKFGIHYSVGFPGDTSGKKKKNLPASTGGVRDVSSFPGLGRSSGEGNVNPL